MSSDPDDLKTSAPPVAKLLSLWKRNELTVEQMVGYMVQHLVEHEKRLQQVEHLLTSSLKPTASPAKK